MILFVGTKRSARDAIKEEAERCGMPYMTQRWLGGTLTNFRTVKASVARLKTLEAGETDGSFDKLVKHEVLGLRRERETLLASDRKSVVWGKSVSGRVDLGGRRILKNKITT